MPGAVVLHAAVVEHVAADLRPPFDLLFLSFQLVLQFAAFVQLDLVELRTQDAHRIFLVHDLRARFGVLDHNPRGQVAQAYAGFDLVDVLAALAAAAVCVPFDVGGVDRDLDRVVHRRRYEHRSEGGLALVVCVERGGAHEAVHAALAFEVAVGELADEFESRRLDSDLLAVLHVDHLDLVTVRFAPAHVHAHQHRSPVEAFGAARAGVDFHDRAEPVLFAAQHVAHFERLDHLQYPAVLRVELLGGRYPLADEFGQQVQLFHRRGDRIVGGDPVFDPGHLFQLLLGLARIVPEVRRMGQRLLLVEFEPPVVDMQVGMERRLPLLERFDLFGGNHLSCRLWLFGSSGSVRPVRCIVFYFSQ